MGKISLKDIKNEIKKSGTSKGKFLFFKEDTKVRIRFLDDMEEGLEIPFHDSFELGINVPCQSLFGRTCKYCDDDSLRTRNLYAWSVYDYEAKEVKILMAAVNNCSPVPALASLYETYGTLTDRDYEIKQIGKAQNKSFSVIPLDKSKFRNTKAKALSEQAIYKYIDKAYPCEDSDDEDIEEEEEVKTKKTKTSPKTKTKKEEQDDWDDEDEDEKDYSSMTPRELYSLCKERELDCKPKKSKEYYIDILEEADEEDDDWGDEEDEDDWDED